MLLAEHALAGLERALIERLGLAVAALGLIQQRQIVDACERVGMLLAEHPLSGLERALQERLGLAVAALGLIERRQIVHASKRVGMLLAEGARASASAYLIIALASAYFPCP